MSDDTSLPPTSRCALAADGVVFAYDDVPVVDGITLDVGGSSSIALMGPSGSGKSTLLLLLAGVLQPDEGEVRYGGRSLGDLGDAGRARLRRQDFGFVFQRANLLPELTVLENTLLGRWIDGDWSAESVVAARGRLGSLGISELVDRYPDQLSGGQLQRAAIARALMSRPAIVFADEPTGALDRQTGDRVIEALTTSCRANDAALVVVTHDPVVAACCERTVTFVDGRITDDTYRPAMGEATGRAGRPASEVA